MKVLFSDKDLGGKYLPVGKSTVQVVATKIDTARTSGNQVLVVELRGVGPGVEGKEGKEILSLEPKARWKISSMAEACGIPRETLLSGEFETSDLLGKVFDFVKQEAGTRMVGGEEKKAYKTFYNKSSIPADQIINTDSAWDPGPSEGDLPF